MDSELSLQPLSSWEEWLVLGLGKEAENLCFVWAERYCWGEEKPAEIVVGAKSIKLVTYWTKLLVRRAGQRTRPSTVMGFPSRYLLEV